jgi:hypothetical protein
MLGGDLIFGMRLGVNVIALVLNVKFRKLGWIEWRWLVVFIAPTTILVVAVDGAPDSPVVHQTGHCTLSGVCHVSTPLGFGVVDHWNPLSCSCTGQSGGTPGSPMAHRTFLVWSDFSALTSDRALFTPPFTFVVDRCAGYR